MTTFANGYGQKSEEDKSIERLKEEEFYYDEEALKKYIDKDRETYEKNKASGNSYTSIIFNFIKQVKIGSDITRISMPAFLLRPISYLELQCDNAVPSLEILDIRSLKYGMNPVQKMLCILKSQLLRLERPPQKGFENSKPYNPILGEYFEATLKQKLSMEDTNTVDSYTLVEQVSHHPPISSFIMINSKLKLVFESTMRVQSTFGTSGVYTNLKGHHVLTLLGNKDSGEDDEEYVFVFPAVVAKIGLTGSTAIEYGELLSITCKKTGLSIKLECKSGNNYKGYMYQDEKKKLIYIEGNWKTGAKYSVISKKSTNPQEMNVLVENIQDILQKEKSLFHKIVKPVHLQDSYESRRVWHQVTKALKMSKRDEAQKCKIEIEESQRRIRKEREKNNQVFSIRFFELAQSGLKVSEDGVQIYQIKKRYELLNLLRKGVQEPFPHDIKEIWKMLP